MTSRSLDCRKLLRLKYLWGQFNQEMRPFWLAQRKRCPYCGYNIPLASTEKNDITRSTWDHVYPRSRWRSHRLSYVICHSACNTIKGDRHPHPCEVLFRDFTNEIVGDIFRPAHRQPQGELQ